MLGGALHEQLEHMVMVAFDKGPVSASILTLDQHFNDATAVWSTVSIVAQENDLRVFAAVFFDQSQNAVQFGQLPMDIADCINRGICL